MKKLILIVCLAFAGKMALAQSSTTTTTTSDKQTQVVQPANSSTTTVTTPSGTVQSTTTEPAQIVQPQQNTSQTTVVTKDEPAVVPATPRDARKLAKADKKMAKGKPEKAIKKAGKAQVVEVQE